MQSRSQVSAEYLLIVGFAAVMLIPLLLIYYTYTSSSSDEIIVSQMQQIANKIVDTAESVYFLGEPSQATIKVNIPSKIVGASLNNREILFNVSASSGISEIVQVSSVNLIGSLPIKQGLYTITLNATKNNVKIGYK